MILQLHSADVLHALYIPAFRIQRNAVPGRTVEMWFKPTKLGSYHAFCTQYCGNGHSLMTTEVVVLDATGYAAKLAELGNIFVDPATKKPLPYAKVGQQLYKTTGCAQCHSVDGSPGQGPTWLGLYKSDVRFSVAPKGYTLSAGDDDAKWDAYLRESILDPARRSSRATRTSCRPTRPSSAARPIRTRNSRRSSNTSRASTTTGPGGKPKYYRPMKTPATERDRRRRRRQGDKETRRQPP